jgi:redox-regulated HSP33 family molecular chaperone
MKTETTGKLQERSIASLKIQCPFCEESYDFPEIMHSKGKAAG